MEKLIKVQSKLLPEIITIAEKRYNILKEIQVSEPIGRRNLAEKLNEGERTIRNEMDFLHDLGLIEITPAGARLTSEGRELLSDLVDYIKVVKGISDLEIEVQKVLNISRVLIVPSSGEVEHDKLELGRFAGKELKRLIDQEIAKQGKVTMAVTGGTTIARIAETLSPASQVRPLTVVPGRGGLGEQSEIQASNIASGFAKKLGGTYRMLQVPDNLTESALHELSQIPQIKEVLHLLDDASILVHGVGTAQEMAKRRGLTSAEMANLESLGAVGEAFGFYFNEQGEIVYTTTSVGLKLDDLAKEDLLVIAVAEGPEKARAILSVVSPQYTDILMTDERTAKQILDLRQ